MEVGFKIGTLGHVAIMVELTESLGGLPNVPNSP